MMRIIAGEFKGHPIKAPKGDGTRPTTDRVRESLMSSVNSILGGFEDARVLDLFAGSGALGLEALSRGAQSACFCEKHPAAIEALSSNLRLAGRSRARIARGDVFKKLPQAAEPFNLLFLDPPYAVRADDVAGLIAGLEAAGSLDPGALVVYEHDNTQDPLESADFEKLGARHLSRKKYGSTIVDIFETGEQ